MAPVERGNPLRWAGAGILFALLVAFFGGSHAVATAREVKADRADNTFYFSYDATAGTIDAASSSLQERRRDPVSHRIYVDSVPGAVIGERLRATVNFRLNAREKRRFSGAVLLEIRDAAGQVVYKATKSVDFTLRPRSGSRGHRVTFRFDLQSGDYSATSTFKAPVT